MLSVLRMWYPRDVTSKVIGKALENTAVLLWAHPHEAPVFSATH